MENKIRHEIIEKLEAQLNFKNSRYNNSFGRSLSEFGDISFITRISDKFERMKFLILNPDIDCADESLLDSVQDMAGYCILFLEEKEKVWDKSNDTLTPGKVQVRNNFPLKREKTGHGSFVDDDGALNVY